MIKIKGNRVFDGKHTYEVGDTLDHLNPDEEKQFIEAGIAEYVGQASATVEKQEETDEEPEEQEEEIEPEDNNEIVETESEVPEFKVDLEDTFVPAEQPKTTRKAK